MKTVRKVFAILENFHEGDEITQLKLETIRTEDVEAVLLSTKPSARQFKNKYESWRKEYESVWRFLSAIFSIFSLKSTQQFF